MAKKNKKTQSLIGQLQNTARESRTQLAAALLDHGLYAGQEQIMLALASDDGQTPSQLAQLLGVRPPTITKTINRLQAQGFLTKSASEDDARVSHIHLSEIGLDAIVAIEKSLRATEKLATRDFDKKERKLLSKLLARMEANFDDDDDDDGKDADNSNAD